MSAAAIGAAPLDEAGAEALIARMLDGAMPDDEIAATLVALAERGENASEIAGAARALRARMIAIAAPPGAIDVCGTGGDGSHSLNVSTAVAIVVAACGVPVAKHGNRAASSRAGAADTLEALGLDLDRAAATAEATLGELGICFLFAQTHHPALVRLAPIRKAIGRRTLFNLLGPLANPARVTRQLVGVAVPAIVAAYAEALRRLGAERAIVVCSEDGLDELSVAGGNLVAEVDRRDPLLRTLPLTARDVGLAQAPLAALRGGDAAYNAAALRALLRGAAGAYRDAVLFNAAAALIVAEAASDWRDGAARAAAAIDSGHAEALLDRWILATR